MMTGSCHSVQVSRVVSANLRWSTVLHPQSLKVFVRSSFERGKHRPMNTLVGNSTLFEFACSDDSISGKQAETVGISCVRLSRSKLNLCNPECVQQALGQPWSTARCWCMGIHDVHTSFTYTEPQHTHAWWTIPKENQEEATSARTTASLCHSILWERFRARWSYRVWAASGECIVEELALLCSWRKGPYETCLLPRVRAEIERKSWQAHKDAMWTSDLGLVQFFSQYVCSGDHEHEEALGKNSAQLAYCRPEFANALVEAWYPQKWYRSVPKLDSASALVTLNLARSAWLQDEKGVQAVLKEAQGLRDNGTCDDSSLIPVAESRQNAGQKGEKIKIAEVLALCHQTEMSPGHHDYKGRIVYRGDAIRDEHHVCPSRHCSHANCIRSAQSHPVNDNAVLCRLHSGVFAMWLGP